MSGSGETGHVQEEEDHFFKNILMGLDLSDQTERAVQAAAALSRAFGSIVHAVTVVNVPTSSAGNEMNGTPANQDEIKLRDEILYRIHKVFGEETRNIDVKVLHGDPGERISEYAEYLNCDLIVVGSRGQGILRKTIFGSVSGDIVNKSKRSVLIVK
jgi:nucleotide-binding universal stress UspA family protein